MSMSPTPVSNQCEAWCNNDKEYVSLLVQFLVDLGGQRQNLSLFQQLWVEVSPWSVTLSQATLLLS